MAAGGAHSCAVAGGGAWCWGSNGRRQLARERGAADPTPSRIEGLPPSVSAVAAGAQHTCAVAAGEVWCWGRNRDGALGREPAERCKGLYGAIQYGLPASPNAARVSA